MDFEWRSNRVSLADHDQVLRGRRASSCWFGRCQPGNARPRLDSETMPSLVVLRHLRLVVGSGCRCLRSGSGERERRRRRWTDRIVLPSTRSASRYAGSAEIAPHHARDAGFFTSSYIYIPLALPCSLTSRFHAARLYSSRRRIQSVKRRLTFDVNQVPRAHPVES